MSWERSALTGLPSALTSSTQTDGAVLLSNGSIAVREGGNANYLGPIFGVTTSGVQRQFIAIYDPDEFGDYTKGSWRTVVDASNTRQFGSPMHLSPHDGKTILMAGGHIQFSQGASNRVIQLFDSETGLWKNDIIPNGGLELGSHAINGGLIVLDNGTYFAPGSFTSMVATSDPTEWSVYDETNVLVNRGSDASIVAEVYDSIGSNIGIVPREASFTPVPDGSLVCFVNNGQTPGGFETFGGLTNADNIADYVFIAQLFPRLTAPVVSAGSTGGRGTRFMGAGHRHYIGTGSPVPEPINTANYNRYFRGFFFYSENSGNPKSGIAAGWAQFSNYGQNMGVGESGAAIYSPKFNKVIQIGWAGTVWEWNPQAPASVPKIKLVLNSTPVKYEGRTVNGSIRQGLSPVSYVGPTVTGSYTGTINDLIESGGVIRFRRLLAQTTSQENITGQSLVDVSLYNTYGSVTFLQIPETYISIDPDDSKPELNLADIRALPTVQASAYYHTTSALWKITFPSSDASFIYKIRRAGGFGDSLAVGGDVCLGPFASKAVPGHAESHIAVLPSGDVCFYGAGTTTGFTTGGEIPMRVYNGTTDISYLNDISPTDLAPPWYGHLMNLPGGKIALVTFPYRPNPALPFFDGILIWNYPTEYAQPQTSWRPIIDKLSNNITSPGSTFTLYGRTLTGVSIGTFSGDDVGDYPNIPLFWLTNAVTGKVVRCFTHHWSYRGIQPNRASTFQVTVPDDAEPGDYTGRVITNGIDSANVVAVTIKAKASDFNGGGSTFFSWR